MNDKDLYLPSIDGKGDFVLHSKRYSSLKDMQQAKRDIERFICCLCNSSFYQINKFLEPYRRQEAKAFDKEIAERETDQE